ncbi:MAG: TonB-dependent receptor [Chlorobiaceae bacterium]|nr:TonB-dependent receptor [Chlorobiaceae bacterium]
MLLSAAVPLPAFSLETISQETVVTAQAEKKRESMVSKRVKSSDTASLLSEIPGVALATGGGVSSLPVVRGQADDRVQVYVDGMCLTSACANHMNPPLSYIAPASVSSIGVNAGVTPVSYGGDNIGGTILVISDQPVFAASGEGLKESGSVSTYYRSINQSTGAAFSGAIAGSNLSFGVTGSIDHANDYKDGHDNTVTSTYYESRNIGATLALKGDSSLLTLKAGHQLIPDQGFVNQWMDMIENNASFFNLRYKSDFTWGKFDATAYWQNTWHKMNSGEDKLPINMRIPATMPDMPMETRGIDTGYSLKTDIPFAEKNILRLGNEFHRFNLNDWWPPISATLGTMGPNTFLNINDGLRDRYAFFAEWESKWNKQVTTIFGVRNEQVRMDAGDVQGYNDQNMAGMMSTNYKRDSEAFNAEDHARSDSNWDLTALARFEITPTGTYEVGYARKTRSPNLYERYAWSTMWMTSGMVNWFGDGNGYVGNLNLNPEVAHTLSISADWHDSARKSWELKVTPYYTYVNDYIGVEVYNTQTWTWPGGSETRNILKFANHDARLYGLDISGKVGLWENSALGSGQLRGSLGYVHGKELNTGGSLYHMMPLNGYLTLEQSLAGWSNAVEIQLVGRKSETDPLRFEPETAGYALLNLRTAYQWKNLRIDLGVTNLFDKFYYLPLGGINYDNFLDSKIPPSTRRAADFGPLAGQGRSFNLGLTQTF